MAVLRLLSPVGVDSFFLVQRHRKVVWVSGQLPSVSPTTTVSPLLPLTRVEGGEGDANGPNVDETVVAG